MASAKSEGFVWLWHYLSRHKIIFLPSLVALFFTAALSLVFPWFLKDLIGDPADALRRGVEAQQVVRKIDSVVVMMLSALALQAFIGFWRVQGFIRSGEAALNDMRKDLFDHLTILPVSFFQEQRTGALSNRISSDLAVVRETLITTVPQAARQTVILIGGLAVVFYSSWKLALMMLACIPLVVLAVALIGRRVKAHSKASQDALSESSTVVEEVCQAIADVKSYGNESYEQHRYGKSLKNFYDITLRGARTRGFFLSFIIFVMFGTIAGVVWMGARMLANDQITQLQFTSFILFSIFVGASLGAFPEIMAQISAMNGASERLREIMALAPERQGGAVLKEFRGELSMDGVTFRYPSRPEREILRGVTFQAKPGQRVALVGSSGGGKSTIFSLLLGFYEAEAGSIRFDGQEISGLDISKLRKQLAVVPQEVMLFGGSIAENIAYGKPGATQGEIEAAAQVANAHEFISTMPEGYQTTVGPRGVKLSGGQRQRIAIARAVLANPRILLLDEATSALDAESERLVNEALERLLQGRTALVIAHRLSTVRDADMILVVHNGQIVESGTHEELMRLAGTYRLLVETQLV
jgi:ABC-type multidrug transport system fused ATPase/permease subunit